MTSVDDWISLAEAYAHILAVRRFPERAQQEMLQKLKSNELGAVAGVLRIGPDFANMNETYDQPLSSYLFQAGHVDFINSGLLKHQGSGSRNPWTLQAVEAKDIRVLRDEVLEFWSDRKSTLQPVVQSDRTRSRGGRPAEHNWEGAYLYCAWYAGKYGLPPIKQRLVEVAIDWFQKNDGGAPKDLKEVGDRIRRLHDEIAKME